MKDLFTPLTRDERQDEAVKKWIQNKGKATIVAATGVGFSKNGSRSVQEFTELLSGNIGETPEMDNPEITEETKASSAS